MRRWPRFIAFLWDDAHYALRRLAQSKLTSAAGILSLALAIGACTSAFRLIDALLLRPLPIAHPERLFSVAFQSPNALDGRPMTHDSNSHPAFLRMKAVVENRAKLIAVSYADRADLTFGSDDEMEKAYTQFVSGDMFAIFGLKPAVGRLFAATDDLEPGAHPIAVISYDYWSARFGRDPRAIGRTFRIGDVLFQIVGVSPAGFTGTETGVPVDVFVPMMMKTQSTLTSWNNFWLRILVQLDPGVSPVPVRDQLAATYSAIQMERSKSVTLIPIQKKTLFNERLLLEPARSGRSNLQRDYRDSLYALAILVTLVLLIASANLSNLMTARAITRSQEMAVRVSLGASRGRLMQLVFVESAWIAGLASLAGAVLSSWATPFIVQMIHSQENPVRLTIAFDFRLLAFSFCLSALITFLFGFPPALRASSSKPAAALRGRGGFRHRGRVMHALIMVQVAFCFVVLLVAGMFMKSFDRLSRQPLGYSPDRILNLESVARRPQDAVAWEQVADALRAVPGVESIAIAAWPLMSGETANSAIATHGVGSEVFADRFMISPGWFNQMAIPILSGREFRAGEARPGPAVVNQAFVKEFFGNESPIGATFDVLGAGGAATHMRVVGISSDVRYRDNLRIPIRPTFFIPFRAITPTGSQQPLGRGTFVVRAAPGVEPLGLATDLRKAVSLSQPEIRVSNIRTQRAIVDSTTVRERLLAILAAFFAAVAMLLAAVGLYGVLDYSVLQQRREIGIRIAVGARHRDIVKAVTLTSLAVVTLGSLIGFAVGIASVRYIDSILFGVRALEPSIVLGPAFLIFAIASMAAAPSVARALRIDPMEMLRAE